MNFFIKIEDLNLYSDYCIAEHLKLDLEEYQKILIECGAKLGIDDECYFNKRKDAERCIEKLETYEIMAKIIE